VDFDPIRSIPIFIENAVNIAAQAFIQAEVRRRQVVYSTHKECEEDGPSHIVPLVKKRRYDSIIISKANLDRYEQYGGQGKHSEFAGTGFDSTLVLSS